MDIASTRFGQIFWKKPSIENTLGQQALDTHEKSARQFEAPIDELGRQGVHFKLEGVKGNNPKLNGASVYSRVMMSGPDTKWMMATLVDEQEQPLPGNPRVADQQNNPVSFFANLMAKAVHYAVEKRDQLPLPVTGRFPTLGDDAAKEYPRMVARESVAAGLSQLSDFVNADRRWKYWNVSLKDGKVLPEDKARQLNQEMGSKVRAFGYGGGMDETMLNNWMSQHNNGVDSWHVDSREGLIALSKVLKEHFRKG